MKIIVMSDSHRIYFPIEKIVSLHPDADMYIHLGDGEQEVNRVITLHPDLSHKFIHIRGNCDFNSLSEEWSVIEAENHRIFASHGHLFNVNYSLAYIRKIAAENNCDIILYGHTHVRYNKYDDGIYIMNPGSVSCPRDGNKPSYGIIEISDAGILTNIADI